MRLARTGTALVGLILGLLVSVAAWIYFETLLLFLFLPFVPFLFTRRGREQQPRSVRQCPRCNFQTADPDHEFCPRDGSRLRQ
ncbi:hypothetical protein [Natrarchaeobaculum sulfurireducens]|uniref:Uncharacterized protein n=1 Tax=Natrarchaeobaculum sulfurireducens TaxID=2044521 RepID=A0A346PQ91_9EURY|nr:hypothetical protein [Natrarchaeobaculum sulfurireducens]AXR78282.1 hypothetical protein AArc1_1962 [Natrarchaeobaculum sulfurireducens]AXR81686.1 hypothetical protein AArcMg_1676 [Natrarchaeobaculum sulfurireducens]